MVTRTKDAGLDKSQHCHTCRRQRLRCDGVRPTCNKCLARGVDCLGYGTQALLWVQPESQHGTLAARNKSQQPQLARESSTEPRQARKKGRPKLVLMQHSTSELSMPNGEGLELTLKPKPAHLKAYMKEMKIRGFHDELLRRRRIILSPSLDPAGYQEQRLIIDSLRYFDEHVSSDLVLFDTSTNPYRVPMEFWSYLPYVVTDPLVSVSAVHRISKTQSTLDVAGYVPGYKVEFRRNRLLSVKHPLVPVVFKHQQRMAGALAAMVMDPDLTGNRGLLEAITTMMLSEVQQSLFGDWDKHLMGAKAVIAGRGGVHTLTQQENNPINYDICTIMQIEVMRDLGSPACLLHDKRDVYDEYLTHVIPAFQDGWFSGFPVTNFLMSSLIQINLARYEDHRDPGGIVGKLAVRRRLLEDIVAFSPAQWLEGQMPLLSKYFQERIDDVNNSISTRSALLDLIQSFQMATMLYAIRTLFLDNGIFALIGNDGEDLPDAGLSPGCGIIGLQQAEASAIEVLHASLQRIWAKEVRSPEWFGKFTIWPQFMLGMSINPITEPSETKDFVCKSLLGLGYYMGSMAYKDAIWAMQHTWERAEKFERSAWLGDLPLDVLPGLFFM